MAFARWLVSIAAATTLSAGVALADDRPPTPEERTRIEAELRRLGYVSWDSIELDDGLWEVDDARTQDGQEYDLKLRPDTLEVVRRERD